MGKSVIQNRFCSFWSPSDFWILQNIFSYMSKIGTFDADERDSGAFYFHRDVLIIFSFLMVLPMMDLIHKTQVI